MSMLDNDPAIEPWHLPHYSWGMEMRSMSRPQHINTIPTKRTIGQRIQRAIVLWVLHSDLESTERYLRDAERVGLMSEVERDGFRRYCQELRVRIAAWEFK